MSIPSESMDVARLLAESPVSHVEYFTSLGSTQDLAHQRAREAAPSLPLLILAEEQTAGRGRGQNRWWTGGGSLAFSVVFDPASWFLGQELIPQRSLAVGVAIVETVAPLIPQQRVGLHWPNDVFADHRKIAGVLVDVLAGGRHIVGIGLNVNNTFAGAPAEVAARATSLCELAGHAFDRTALLCDLLRRLQRSLQASTSDPAGFGERFQSLCLQVGDVLTIEVAGKRISGRCAGIGADGALLLDSDSGLTKHYSGVLVHDR